MKRFLYIFSALLFLVPYIAFAADYYADPSGSGTTCGDGTECTIEYCIESKASSGDTCHLNDGTYVTASLEIPVGVSVQGRNSDKTLVTINPSSNDSSNPFISFYSASPGTSGSQSLSYVTVDGTATYNFTHGIRVVNRDGVTIHDVDIQDFTGSGGTPSTAGSGGGSYGLYVRSTEQAQNASWWNYFDNDGTKSSSWSTNPVQNFSYYNGDMENCGYGDNPETSRTFSPAIYVFDLKTFTFHDLNIDVSHTQTEGIRGNCAILEDGSFYNIYILCNSAGRIYGSAGSESCYGMELWVFDNVLFHHIKISNGGLSLAYGLDCEIYAAYIDQSSATSPTGYGIEWTLQINGSIHDCRVRGNESAGAFYGYHLGTTSTNVPASYTTRAYNLYAYDIRRDGFRISADGGSTAFTVSIPFHNNFIDNCSTGYTSYAGVWLQDANDGTLSVTGRNNIVTNSYNGIKIGAGSPTTDFQYTALAGNTNNTVGSVTISNTISTEPTYEDYANKDFDHDTGSSGIYSGVLLGLPYDLGINPSTTVWGSGSTLPVVNTVLHSAQDASNASLGPAAYLSAADVIGPVVSEVTPNGELSYGTTSTAASATSNDAAGTTAGCKWDTTDVVYGSMANTMTGSGDGEYTDTFTGLTNDTEYHYYGACIDDSDNITPFDIIFNVAASTETLVCDDADACATLVGTWPVASRSDAYNGNHHYSNTNLDTASFDITIANQGYYSIQFHTFDGYHDTTVSTSIEYSGDTDTDQVVNMNGIDAGEWVPIATYPFTAGTYTTTFFVDAGGYVIADGVRAVYVGPLATSVNCAAGGNVGMR